MAEVQDHALFYNSENGDRIYDADSFEHLLKKFFTSGVFAGSCQVTADGTGMNCKVGAGYANCDGKVRFFRALQEFSIENANATYNRIDTIVIERNDTDRDITCKVVKGSYSARPTATAPVRTDGIYQLVLAEIYVAAGAVKITQGNITDRRPVSTVCGYVMCAVNTPDFTELFAQFQSQAGETIATETADFEAWFETMKDQLSQDAAGNLQNQVDALKSGKADTSVTDSLSNKVTELNDNKADKSATDSLSSNKADKSEAIANITPTSQKTTYTVTRADGSTFTFEKQKSAVTDGNPTLAWGTQSTVAVIDGTEIHVKLPTNPNTWNANTRNQAGYVSAPGNANMLVWKTDASGNPAWRTDANTDTNTWRDITNSLSSTSQTISLSAYAGKQINDKLTKYLKGTGGGYVNFHENGNLELHPAGTSPFMVLNQGSLAMYESNGNAWKWMIDATVFAIMTSTGYKLTLQNDGNLVLYNKSGTAIWNTNTAGK